MRPRDRSGWSRQTSLGDMLVAADLLPLLTDDATGKIADDGRNGRRRWELMT
jgi:hypothetical protein